MKKQKQKSAKTDYNYVEKNIYKTGTSYRVRVSGQSTNCRTLTEARKFKRFLKTNATVNIF